MTICRGYVSRWQLVTENGKPPRTDYWFNSKIENAAHWPTRQDAENDCVLFNRGILIPSNEGGTHVCKGFKVEERTPVEYVVYCDAPFIIAESPAGQSTES